MKEEIGRPGEGETAAIRALWESCFSDGSKRFNDWYFSFVYKAEDTLCLYEGGALASSLQMIPYILNIRGKKLLVNTLSGVSTYAASRNRGLARKLMAASLADMAARGVGLTFLYPFDHGFYERLGWATCSAALEYHIPAVELPGILPEGYTVRSISNPDLSVLSEIYAHWSAGRNCFSVRETQDWVKRLGENEAS
jgi:predicted acetyltransferase